MTAYSTNRENPGGGVQEGQLVQSLELGHGNRNELTEETNTASGSGLTRT